MKRAALLTAILVLGLALSQLLPVYLGEMPPHYPEALQLMTMTLLAFIMIQVGREFAIDLKNRHQYLVDYGVAATAAAFPWIFCTLYFLAFLMPEQTHSSTPPWIEALLAARFAAPTSAGVLFSMLAAAGLSATWTFRKTRILAIFDDLDTVLFMIPLKILLVGWAWQMGAAICTMAVLLLLGWKFYRRLRWPCSWPWIILYSLTVTALSEITYVLTQDEQTRVGMHIEILLPAFLLGCALSTKHPKDVIVPGENPPGLKTEEKVGLTISAAFMLLVGLSMPAATGANPAIVLNMEIPTILLHVLAVTVVANLGKMFTLFCYKKEASFKERLAVSIALFPRGEVGAGVLALSLSYGIQGPFLAIAFLSLALNLILTGGFIYIVKRLISA
ncbi:sodium:proton antiporter [Bdellovibrio bacteriovorus]|uniref:sodium:proton antiporter n=1 Tax=Bdellovibrio bacteriovorus TaxID=959 RepID=UPI0035A5B01A